MNQLNKFLQDPVENVLASSDTIFEFKRKLDLRKNHVVKENLEMFPLLLGLESEGYQEVSSVIENYSEELQDKIKHYLFSLPFNTSVWLAGEPPL
jgi:hemerythrin-like domain-containing protein